MIRTDLRMRTAASFCFITVSTYVVMQEGYGGGGQMTEEQRQQQVCS